MVKDFFGEDYGLMDHRTFGSGPFPGCDENLYKKFGSYKNYSSGGIYYVSS